MRWKQVIRNGVAWPYEVSDEGQVRSIERVDCIGRHRKSRELAQADCGGYLLVTLCLDKKRWTVMVHILVAFAFLPPPPGEYGRGKIQVNHYDTNKKNNRWTNFEWQTPKGNRQHAAENGCNPRGEAHHNAVLSADDVAAIKKLLSFGATPAALGREFGVSHTTVRNIRDGKVRKFG